MLVGACKLASTGSKVRGRLVTASVIDNRSEGAAKALVEASLNNLFLRKTLVRIYWVMQGGEIAGFVAAVGIASMVDSDRLALDNTLVAFTIGNDIPQEVWDMARAKAEQETSVINGPTEPVAA